jgi:hypothetical protein
MKRGNVPHVSRLERYSTPKIAGINDPEGPKNTTTKKNITTLKYEATFYRCHTALDTCCCDDKPYKYHQRRAIFTESSPSCD